MSLFHRVTAPNGNVSYLFGTMRTNDVVTMPSEVKYVLERAANIVLEVDLSFSAEINQMLGEMIRDWKELQFINEARFHEYVQVVKDVVKQHLIKQGRYFAAVSEMRKFEDHCRNIPPVMISSVLFSPDFLISPQDTIEHQLKARASQSGQTVHYLQSTSRLFAEAFGRRFSFEQQLDIYFFIKSYVERGGKLSTEQDFKQHYREQNIDALDLSIMRPFSDALEADIPPVVMEYFQDNFISRGASLAVSMNGVLEAGNAFIAVGAGHLAGIIKVLRVHGFDVEPITTGEFKYPIAGTLEENDKVSAFRRIYNALYAGQSSVLKSRNRGILETDDVNIIIRHASANPASRTAKAWELANQHAAHISLTNTELFESIHRYSYQQSSSSFFKKSKNFGDASHYAEAEAIIAQADADSRTGRIRAALG